MLTVDSTVNGCSLTVEKNKTKASTRSQQPSQINSHPDLVPSETKARGLDYYKDLCETKNQTILQLRKSLLSSNRKFEAFTVVVQNIYTQVRQIWFLIVLPTQGDEITINNVGVVLFSTRQTCCSHWFATKLQTDSQAKTEMSEILVLWIKPEPVCQIL